MAPEDPDRRAAPGTPARPSHETNRAHWDEITPVHLASDLYRFDAFIAGLDKLDATEVEAVGDVRGKRLLHLQCHFGQDTLSWARRGADVTGVDFSAPALAEARQLAARCDLAERARFIESDVLDLDLGETFDVVYTSRGVLGWLEDLDQWGEVVSRHLAPGGVFFMQEFHPVSFLFDEDISHGYRVKWPYFHMDTPIVETGPDYADQSYQVQNPAHSWVWSLSDVFNALSRAGLQVVAFTEFPWTRYRQFPGFTEGENLRWWPPEGLPRVPLVFNVKAVKAAE